MKYVSDAAGMENVGLRTYRAPPGVAIPFSELHHHDEQEGVCYVVLGTLSVETPDDLLHVEEGQFFVAEPGSAHRAHNADDADESVRVIGMGGVAGQRRPLVRGLKSTLLRTVTLDLSGTTPYGRHGKRWFHRTQPVVLGRAREVQSTADDDVRHTGRRCARRDQVTRSSSSRTPRSHCPSVRSRRMRGSRPDALEERVNRSVSAC